MAMYTVAIAGCFILTILGLWMWVEDAEPTCGMVLTGVFGLILVLSIAAYDDTVINKADEFFATREKTYKCEDLGKLKCQYKIQQWQEDSVYWAEKVSEILKEK
jgi:hypothetical protein